MKEVEFTDKIMHRWRTMPKIVIVDPEGNPHLWNGKSIPGVAVITYHSFTKNGAWSHNYWKVALDDRAYLLMWNRDWGTGKWLPFETLDKLAAWLVSKAPNINIEKMFELLKQIHPAEFQRIEENTKAVEELENAGDFQEVVFSFGMPTRRQIQEGFWVSPKTQEVRGVKITVFPDSDWGWQKPRVETDPEIPARILSVDSSPGYHGGWVRVKVGVTFKQS